MDGEAVYYGLNALSHNVIMANPEKSSRTPTAYSSGCPFGKILCGKAGAGKCVPCHNKDRIIVVDPMGDYSPLISGWADRSLRLPRTAPHHINPDGY